MNKLVRFKLESSLVSFVVAVFINSSCLVTAAPLDNTLPTFDRSNPKYAPGQMIIKFRDLTNDSASQGLANPQLGSNISNFDELNLRHRAIKMKRLFRDKEEPFEVGDVISKQQARVRGVTRRAEFFQKVQGVKAKHAKRTKRNKEQTPPPYLGNIYTMTFDDKSIDIEALCREYAKDPDIEYAEPNYLATVTHVPQDPRYTEQWAHQVTQAETAWDTTTGNSSVVIAVIDTGVDTAHEDLNPNLLPGWDFVDVDVGPYGPYQGQLYPNEDYTVPDADPSDFDGHGTICAGIVGAVEGNDLGVVGVCPNCKIMPLRAGFSLAGGGYLENSAIVQAIRYAADNGADIINMSFGGPLVRAQIDALDYAYALGLIMVASAGNKNTSVTSDSYPAAYDNVIGVANTLRSSDMTESKSITSNYGYWIDVAAPGTQILSTCLINGRLSDPTGFKSESGTSMAAPYVAGMAGLILSKNPSWPNNQVRAIIKRSVDIDKIVSTRYIGTGRVNLAKAMAIESLPSDTAEITSPINGDSFYSPQLINIMGTAAGTSYEVKLGGGYYPKDADWLVVGQGTTATNGLLAQLDSQMLSRGPNTILLAVRTPQEVVEDKIFLFGLPKLTVSRLRLKNLDKNEVVSEVSPGMNVRFRITFEALADPTKRYWVVANGRVVSLYKPDGINREWSGRFTNPAQRLNARLRDGNKRDIWWEFQIPTSATPRTKATAVITLKLKEFDETTQSWNLIGTFKKRRTFNIIPLFLAKPLLPLQYTKNL